jgi:hypothetical protein
MISTLRDSKLIPGAINYESGNPLALHASKYCCEQMDKRREVSQNFLYR